MSINWSPGKPIIFTRFNPEPNNEKSNLPYQNNSNSTLKRTATSSPSHYSKTSNLSYSTSSLKSGTQPKSIMKKPSLEPRNSGSLLSSYNSKQYFSELFSGGQFKEDLKNSSQSPGTPEEVSYTHTPIKKRRNHVSFEDLEKLNPSQSFTTYIIKELQVKDSLNNESKGAQRHTKKKFNSDTSVINAVAKDCCFIYKKKDTSSAEKEKLLNEIRVKKLKNSKYKQFIYDIMNKISVIKGKLESDQSDSSQVVKSFVYRIDHISMFDLQCKVIEDIDTISSLTEQILTDISEVKEIKNREKQLFLDLNEAIDRENILKGKIELEKSKSFELANIKIEQERDLDKKELNFNRDKLDYIQKIEDIETELLRVVKEKENLLKDLNEFSSNNKHLKELIKSQENELKKQHEVTEALGIETEMLTEKLKSKIFTEEILTLKLKSYEPNQATNQLIEKITKLEETIKQKNSEISELKNKLFLESIKDRNAKFQELSFLSQDAESPSEKLVKSQEREIKRLNISLELLQRENSILFLSKDKVIPDQDSLFSGSENYENRVKLLINENKRLKSELFEALDYAESAKISRAPKGLTSIQNDKLEQLRKSKESIVEELALVKEKSELKEDKINNLRSDLQKLKCEIIQKEFDLDLLANQITQLKSFLSSKELESSYQVEKEAKLKEQINEYIFEIKKITGEVSKLKEDNFNISQEIIKKNYQLDEIKTKTESFQREASLKSEELERLSKNLTETQDICRDQEKLIKDINEEKKSIQAKQLETQEENQNLDQINKRLDQQVAVLQKALSERETELRVYLDQEKKISSEIEEIEKVIKNQPRRSSLKPLEEVKLVNEEKFRLKSLLVYKDTQIRILKDKFSSFRNEYDLRNLKRQNSLLSLKK